MWLVIDDHMIPYHLIICVLSHELHYIILFHIDLAN